MPTRNISAIGSSKPIPIFIWIPPKFNPTHKIEVYDVDTDTAYDVTDLVIGGEYTWGKTETIGKFEFTIDNSAQDYLSIFTPYDELRVYMDYGATATTLRFKGLIERVSKKDFKLVLSGRGPATRYIAKNVTYSTTGTARATILSAVIAKYFTDLTTTNLEADTTTAKVNYYERPFWEFIEDICGQSGYDAYVDSVFDFHYFAPNSRRNTTEAIVHEYNLIETGDFAPDASNIFNRITVYGAEIGEIPTIATASDTNSQTQYKVRDLKINDTNITTQTQAQARADYELARNKDPPTVGLVTSLGLPTIAPGEQIRVSDPLNGLNPGYYEVFEFTHKFSNDDPFMTEIKIKKERGAVSGILKKRLKFESESTKNVNPNEMENSVIYDFITDTGTHSSTEITGGVLKTDGASSGTWESDVTTTSAVVSGAEVRINANDLSGVFIYVSFDGGANYTQVVGTPGTQVSATGNHIKVRVRITSADTRIKALGILYKT